MPEASYLPIVERLASFEPAVYVFGGIAQDALLDGSITRPHGDVDVLVARATLDRHLEALRGIGFGDLEVFVESPPSSNWRASTAPPTPRNGITWRVPASAN